MLSTFYILLLNALFSGVMFFVLLSLLRSEVAGVKAWVSACALTFVALLLYAWGNTLPPLIAYEMANGTYAAATASILVGFRQFYARKVPWRRLGWGIAGVVAGTAWFHYGRDSFGMRTAIVSLFHAWLCFWIVYTAFTSRRVSRSRYPYIFTKIVSASFGIGHLVRGVIFLTAPDAPASLLEPSQWNLVFLTIGTLVLPVLVLGAAMMVHDRMIEKAEHAANRDFLTSAWSRRAFFEIAEREVARARRHGRPLSLLLMDIDHFKCINDKWGHAGGDAVLVDIVLRVEDVIRNVDYLARIGGEEFAVLLPETDCAAAVMTAERLRMAVDRATPGNPDAVRYTVSLGVAEIGPEEHFDELMRRADGALYRAKEGGRNRVAIDAGNVTGGASQARHPFASVQ